MSRGAFVSRLGFLALVVSVGCSGAGSPVSPAAVGQGSLAEVPGPFVPSAPTVSILSKTDAGMVLTPGDLIDLGYVFTISGKHPATTVAVAAASVTFHVVCGNGAEQDLYIALPAAPYVVPANYTGWTPAGGQSDPAVYQWQEAALAPCGPGETFKPKNGATFEARITADQNVKINVKFHWRANGSAGGYSSTKTVTPLSPPPT